MTSITSRIISYIPIIIQYLQAFYDRKTKTPNTTTITSLAPVDWADKDDIYTNTLRSALDNRRQLDIKNIAITGPYGSGKSSIIKSFQRKVYGENYKFLNISLATFKEEKDLNNQSNGADHNQNGKPDEKGQQEQLRLIELSILQQIFYAEKPEDIPDSRFKRIQDLRNWKIAVLSFGVMAYAFSIFFLTKSAFFGYQIHEYLQQFSWYTWLKWIALLIFGAGSWFFLARSIRTISKLRLTKISIQDADFEVDQSVSKSILNHHVDELIYFFEVTKYNVVIIEDLDRFQQTEIFTKLREINLLINKSKRINRDIVFIYAVRDDMFKENERTKFFDFILPVIPVINASNSSQKLIEKNQTLNYQWSEDIIEDLAIFVDDMRLLHNITNEFQLYRKKLNTELDENKLLAILIYKNLYPGDFSQLSEGNGYLYGSINQKPNLIRESEVLLDEKINQLNINIEQLEHLKITDQRELNTLYLIRVIAGLPGFTGFSINGGAKSLDEMLDEENFAYIIKGEAKYTHNSSGYGNQLSAISKWSAELEKAVDKHRSYKERKRLVLQYNTKRIENCKIEIQNLLSEKYSLRNSPLSSLLPDEGFSFSSENAKQNALINILLRNGYIAEDYADYISLFYEGSLTKADYGFVLNVKSRRTTNFDYSIIKVAQVIKKINLLDFGKHYILNYKLVDFLLANGAYQQQLSSVMNILKDDSDRSVQFIDGMLNHSAALPGFVTSLCSVWHNMWEFIEDRSNYPREKVDQYFLLIMEFANKQDIEKVAETSRLAEFVLEKPHFTSLIPDSHRFALITDALDLKFTRLEENSITKEQVNYIHEVNAYALNIDMVSLIVKATGNFDQVTFDTSNFSFIQQSNCNFLIKYVDSNIDDYIQNIYLAIETNVNEEQDYYISLLNHESADDELLSKVIKQVDTIVPDIRTIQYSEVAQMLFELGKIVSSWSNVYEQYMTCEQKFPEYLVEFINEDVNSTELAAHSTKDISFKDDTKLPFVKSILENNNISDISYDLLVSSIETQEDEFDIAHLSSQKITSLIRRRILPFDSVSLNQIKKSHVSHSVLFLEYYKDFILDNWDNFDFNGYDIGRILNSNTFTSEEKQSVLDRANDSLIITNSFVLKSLTAILLTHFNIRLRPAVLEAILLNPETSSEDRVSIFNTRASVVDYLENFVSKLEPPYANIATRGQKPKLTKNASNLRFAEILKSRNFISSYRENDENIKINTFIKDQKV